MIRLPVGAGRCDATLRGLRALHGDPRAELLAAMAAAGIVPADPSAIVADGTLHRFAVDGDRRGRANGWAVLYLDPDGSAGGAFGSWKLGTSGTWRSGRGKMSAAERTRLHQIIKSTHREAARQRDIRQLAAQTRAIQLWDAAGSADPKHPYLQRKCVNPWDIRQRGDALMISMRDIDGSLWSLQFIAPDGSKRFLSGGLTAGLFHLLGEPVTTRVAIAEGYSTAASIYEAEHFELPVACAFSAGNLRRVACAVRLKNPFAEIIVCGDRDPVGIKSATEAAHAVNGRAVFPLKPFVDFNDLACAEVAA